MQDPTEIKTEVLVIGSGPAGEGAAMKASKDGKDVVLAERYEYLGGGCTHWGTIPSKALRHAVRRNMELRSVYPSLTNAKRMTFPELLKESRGVINKQVRLRTGFYVRNDIQVIQGAARFVDPHTVWIVQDNGGVVRVVAEHIVIATGSSPFHPDGLDFGHARIRDSDTILDLDEPPQSITIFGAGVIGCEYASIFKNLGVKVNLINGRDKLLSFLDDEIVDALAYQLRDQGVVIRHNECLDSVEADADKVVFKVVQRQKDPFRHPALGPRPYRQHLWPRTRRYWHYAEQTRATRPE